jgi:hypothetical protein
VILVPKRSRKCSVFLIKRAWVFMAAA